MVYRNKVYVCFDGDNDMCYYRLMQAWKENDGIEFDFYDAHMLNYIDDSNQEETIKRKLKEKLNNSRIFIVLVGGSTKYLYKFVRWEIEQAINLDLPIVVVNINGKRNKDENNCPPILKNELAVHISFNAKIMQYAIVNWGASHEKYSQIGAKGAYFYKPEVYEKLGL